MPKMKWLSNYSSYFLGSVCVGLCNEERCDWDEKQGVEVKLNLFHAQLELLPMILFIINLSADYSTINQSINRVVYRILTFSTCPKAQSDVFRLHLLSNQDSSFTILDKEKQQICTFKKLEPVNVDQQIIF